MFLKKNINFLTFLGLSGMANLVFFTVLGLWGFLKTKI